MSENKKRENEWERGTRTRPLYGVKNVWESEWKNVRTNVWGRVRKWVRKSEINVSSEWVMSESKWEWRCVKKSEPRVNKKCEQTDRSRMNIKTKYDALTTWKKVRMTYDKHTPKYTKRMSLITNKLYPLYPIIPHPKNRHCTRHITHQITHRSIRQTWETMSEKVSKKWAAHTMP